MRRSIDLWIGLDRWAFSIPWEFMALGCFWSFTWHSWRLVGSAPKNPLPKPQGRWQIWWWPNDWHHGQFCDSGRGWERSRVWWHVVPQWSPETLETEVALLETWFDEQEGFLALNWSVFDRFLMISPWFHDTQPRLSCSCKLVCHSTTSFGSCTHGIWHPAWRRERGGQIYLVISFCFFMCWICCCGRALLLKVGMMELGTFCAGSFVALWWRRKPETAETRCQFVGKSKWRWSNDPCFEVPFSMKG